MTDEHGIKNHSHKKYVSRVTGKPLEDVDVPENKIRFKGGKLSVWARTRVHGGNGYWHSQALIQYAEKAGPPRYRFTIRDILLEIFQQPQNRVTVHQLIKNYPELKKFKFRTVLNELYYMHREGYLIRHGRKLTRNSGIGGGFQYSSIGSVHGDKKTEL